PRSAVLLNERCSPKPRLGGPPGAVLACQKAERRRSVMNAYLWSWAGLAIAVLILAAYRIAVGSREDQTLHLHQSEGALLASQEKVSRRVTVLDKWGVLLTVVLAAYGLVLLGIYFL